MKYHFIHFYPGLLREIGVEREEMRGNLTKSRAIKQNQEVKFGGGLQSFSDSREIWKPRNLWNARNG